jgi:YebC/PmpR family DNA-binding regulatory protein
MGRAYEFRKARKIKRWSKMSKTFTRISKEISISVKESGADPNNNSRLRSVIQNAKTVNMPKENIERAIKKASEVNSEKYKEILYEGYGPFGIAILVETATDNNNRTVANLRSYFNKFQGNLGKSGSVEFMFEKKCNFKLDNKSVDIEELELEFIDFGVDEVFVDDNKINLYGDFNNFGLIQKELEKKFLKILYSGFERFPKITTKLNSEEFKKIEILIESIESDDDVQNVYHNIELRN